MKTITVNSAFTPDYMRTPKQFTIGVTPELKTLISAAFAFLNTWKGKFETVTIPFMATPAALGTPTEWVPDSGHITVWWTGAVYYGEQSKYDAAAQIESESVPIAKFLQS